MTTKRTAARSERQVMPTVSLSAKQTTKPSTYQPPQPPPSPGAGTLIVGGLFLLGLGAFVVAVIVSGIINSPHKDEYIGVIVSVAIFGPIVAAIMHYAKKDHQ